MKKEAPYPERIVVTVTQEMKDKMKDVAASFGLDVSSFLRMKIIEMISNIK